MQKTTLSSWHLQQYAFQNTAELKNYLGDCSVEPKNKIDFAPISGYLDCGWQI